MAPDRSSDPRSAQPGCAASDHCRDAIGLLRALGVPPSLAREAAWRWVHIDPIDPADPFCTIHHDDSSALLRVPLAGSLLTDFRGYSLDALGLRTKPWFLAAAYNELLDLWLVYASASHQGGPSRVEWTATPDGPGRTVKVYEDAPVSARLDEVLERGLDLALGRQGEPGRRRHGDAAMLKMVSTVDRVERLHTAGSTYEQACNTAGVPERTFRAWRTLVRRWRWAMETDTWRRQA